MFMGSSRIMQDVDNMNNRNFFYEIILFTVGNERC